MIAKIIILALYSVSLLLNAYLHGKERKGNYNFWYTFVWYIMMMSLLYFSGFFNGILAI